MHIAGFDSCPSICNIRFTSSSSLHTWWFYAPSDRTYIGPVSCVLWRHILEQSHVDCGTTHRTTLMWIVAPHIGPLSCGLWHHTSDQSHVCCGATYCNSLMWIVAPHIGPLSCGLWRHISDHSHVGCGTTHRTSLMCVVAPHIGPVSCGLWRHISNHSHVGCGSTSIQPLQLQCASIRLACGRAKNVSSHLERSHLSSFVVLIAMLLDGNSVNSSVTYYTFL